MEASTLVHHMKLRVCGSSSACAVVSLFLIFAVGCDEPKAEAAAERPAEQVGETPKQEAPPAAAPAEVVGKLSGQASYDEDAFSLQLVPPEKVSSGQAALFQVILTAKSGYKVNDEYPIKFQLIETPGVTFEKSIVKKEDAKIEKTRAELPLNVTVQAKGAAEVSGKLSFSVCTEERCLIEKRDLTVKVDAS